MHKFLISTLLFLAPFCANSAPPVRPVPAKPPSGKGTDVSSASIPKIRFQIEVNASEIESLGLKPGALEQDILTRLIQYHIHVDDDPQNALLLLRIKTILTKEDVATFVQLAFFEEAELTRTKDVVMAMTWSQAALLTTSTQNYSAEVTKTVLNMTTLFARDFLQAFQVAVEENKGPQYYTEEVILSDN